MRVEVSYFAALRDHAAKSREKLEIESEQTARELYIKLQEIYGFPLSFRQLRVAVNDDFAPLDSPLKEGDHVVFIPPVAGG